ncbi:MAG: hypothetical protein HY537_01910 [Deltaproteobacteria bacterium]|nr:hypothetical protein [Deltaproteobacteria bacterium]
MKQEKTLKNIDRAIAMIDKSLATYPDDDLLSEVRETLVSIRNKVSERWPLPKKETTSEYLSIFALRNLDDIMPDLASAIYNVHESIEAGRKRKKK